MFYPLTLTKCKLSKGMQDMSQLPTVIKERNIEYQLHRIKLFTALLHVSELCVLFSLCRCQNYVAYIYVFVSNYRFLNQLPTHNNCYYHSGIPGNSRRDSEGGNVRCATFTSEIRLVSFTRNQRYDHSPHVA